MAAISSRCASALGAPGSELPPSLSEPTTPEPTTAANTVNSAVAARTTRARRWMKAASRRTMKHRRDRGRLDVKRRARRKRARGPSRLAVGLRGPRRSPARADYCAMAVATDQSLRGFLERLERDGGLRRVSATVSPRFELSAMLACEDDGPALLFESVAGSSMAVVGGVLGSRARLAAGLGVPFAALQERMLAALAAPIPPREVTDAPCQELVVRVARPRGAADPVVLRTRDRALSDGGGDRGARRRRRPREPLDRSPETARGAAGDGRHRSQPPPGGARAPRGGARRDAADRRDDRQPPGGDARLDPLPRARRGRAPRRRRAAGGADRGRAHRRRAGGARALRDRARGPPRHRRAGRGRARLRVSRALRGLRDGLGRHLRAHDDAPRRDSPGGRAGPPSRASAARGRLDRRRPRRGAGAHDARRCGRSRSPRAAPAGWPR